MNQSRVSWATRTSLTLFVVCALACSGASAVERELATRIERAESLYHLRQFDAAITALRTLTQDQPASARAWLRLGNALEQVGDNGQALTAYQSAAAIALPSSQVFGYLEARQLRGKALLNLARLGLIQVRQVLDEYVQSGALQREFGELQQQETNDRQRLRRSLREELNATRNAALNEASNAALNADQNGITPRASALELP